MPGLDGWMFIESYRASAGAEVPIVSVSAVMSDPVAERLQQLGVRVCLTKPFDIAEFLECVARLLGVAPASLRAPSPPLG